MEPDRIKELLEKYFQAETSEEEEAELQQYFANTPGLENHPASALFDYFSKERQITMPGGINAGKTRPIKWLAPLLKVAAVLVIVVSLVYLFLPGSKPAPLAKKETDTYDNPQQAYLETRKALLLISHHLNKGENYITEISKINKAEQLINTKEEKR